MPRLFYGIEIPNAQKAALAALQQEMKRSGVEAGNWSGSDLFHITVVFLGELDPSARTVCDQVGHDSVSGIQPFELTLAKPGSFERNRILWVGLRQDAGSDALTALHAAVKRGVEAHQLAPVESRPYRPHLTLARKLNVSTYHTFEASTEHRQSSPPQSFTVDKLCLFESRREGGRLVYPVIESYRFS